MSQNKSTTDANTAENRAPTSYKQQLDDAASEVKYPKDEGQQGGVVDKVVETVSQYVPAVGSVLGKGQKEEDAAASRIENIDTEVPALPRHNTQVEEFVRDQHRSNTDGLAIGRK